MKKLFQYGYGWPALAAALILGFGGAALSAKFKNHWWFIIGFAIDLVLVIGFILTCDEEGEKVFDDKPQEESAPPQTTQTEQSSNS